jgi:hypothetical protein
MNFFEKILEKSLNELIMNWIMNIFCSLLGTVIGLTIKIKAFNAILGTIIGLLLSIIIQKLIHIHYFGKNTVEILGLLKNQPKSIKRFFRILYEKYGRDKANSLISLRANGILSSDFPLEEQLLLIKTCFEQYKEPNEAWHVWNFNKNPLDIIETREIQKFLNNLALLYKEMEVKVKNRFIIINNAHRNNLKSYLDDFNNSTLNLSKDWNDDDYNSWYKLFLYHKKKCIKLFWIFLKTFDTSIKSNLNNLDDFVFIKFKKETIVFGINHDMLIFNEYKVSKISKECPELFKNINLLLEHGKELCL